MSKEELLLPARSESSCSLQSRELQLESSNISPELGGPLCDSSSEVSDEGYKSSQGNVSSKTATVPGSLAAVITGQEDGERSGSSMTVGSDCSSTISSEEEEEEEEEDNTASSHLEDQDGSSSLTVIAASPEKK